MKKTMLKKHTIKTVLLIWVIMMGSCGGNTIYGSDKEAPKMIDIPQGASSSKVIQILKENHIIKRATPFKIYLKLKGIDRNLKAGSFFIFPNASYKEITDILQEKKGPAGLTKITIPEGYTVEEIGKVLENKGIINDIDKFLEYVKLTGKSDLINDFPFLEQVPTTNLEGYLFPNTYIFAKRVSNKKIVSHFLKGFSGHILPLWKKYPHKMGLHKVVTLASIVEKEAYKHAEMPIIAGVFHNRLRRRMLLASCPTVGYAMGEPRKKYLTYTDLKYKSIYNTYIHRGLPPTPIAGPGVQAFKAVLKPQKTNYYYFVANGDGTHTFTSSLKQHLRRQKEIILAH